MGEIVWRLVLLMSLLLVGITLFFKINECRHLRETIKEQRTQIQLLHEIIDGERHCTELALESSMACRRALQSIVQRLGLVPGQQSIWVTLAESWDVLPAGVRGSDE